MYKIALFNIIMILALNNNFDPYNVLLAIATNTPVWLMTGFMAQGHIWFKIIKDHSNII